PLRRALRRSAAPQPHVLVRHARRRLLHPAPPHARRGEGVLRPQRALAGPRLRGGPQAARPALLRAGPGGGPAAPRVAGGGHAGGALLRRGGALQFSLPEAPGRAGPVSDQSRSARVGPAHPLSYPAEIWLSRTTAVLFRFGENVLATDREPGLDIVHRSHPVLQR